MAGVEDRRQLVPGDDLVEVVGHAVVGEEALHGRMELEALDHARFDQVARLPDPHPALVRVDRGEGDHHVGIGRGGLRHFLVGDAPVADLVLAVDGEHHEADLSLAIIGDGFGDGRPLAGLEVFIRRVLVGLPEGVGRLAAGDLGVGVHVDGDEVVDLHGVGPLPVVLLRESSSGI